MSIRNWFTNHPDKDAFAKMSEELEAIRKKYGIPKGILLVPDRLEFALKRKSYDNFHLTHRQYYDYLPEMVLEIIIPMEINQLVQMGFPQERIGRSGKNGVYLEIDGPGDFMTSMILGELAVQRKYNEKEYAELVDATKVNRKTTTDAVDLQFEWSSSLEKRYSDYMMKMMEVTQRNPFVMIEMANVIRKYSESVGPMWSLLEKKQEMDRQRANGVV
ncbi:MAG: hypothetical protein ACE14S_11550 [Candidatus Bathyarchaeia archaeon]